MYRVNNPALAAAMQKAIRQFCQTYDVTFITFNYDGLIEAFLDVVFGTSPEFLYVPELSHGIPVAMPENVYFRHDRRDLGGTFPRLTRVLKPHGSMHFFRLRSSIEGMLNTTQIVALHPRLDLRWNSKTMQRDVPFDEFWQFADSVPFIVAPLINKEGLLSTDYFSEVLRLSVDAIARADAVISLGFSLPKSDLHVCAAFELGTWKGKRLGLCYRNSPEDITLANWQRVASGASIVTLSDHGLPTSDEGEINAFWLNITAFVETH